MDGIKFEKPNIHLFSFNSPFGSCETCSGFGEVIGIDEAQFFDNGIVKICNDLANEGIRVIVAGLDMDYKGNPFGPMPNLMAVAEYVTKVHAICAKSGKLANHSHRISTNKSLIHLGEKESYMALSRLEFQKLIQKNKNRKEKP